MKSILKATAVMGGSSLVTVAAGIVKSKAIALLLGPAGVGLMALYQSVMTTVATVSSLGLGGSSVREVAAANARGDATTLAGLWRVLLWTGLLLGLAGGLAVALLRDVIAARVLGDPAQGGGVGWVGLGVAAATVANIQIGWINGFRRLGDIAAITIWSAVAGAAVGIAAIMLFGSAAVVATVVSAPVLNLLIATWYVRRARVAPLALAARAHWPLVRSLVALGLTIMATSLLALGAQLAVRLLIADRLGLEAVGRFEAAWRISMLYLSFILGAMITDYYPRLAERGEERAELGRIANEQAFIALTLVGSALLWLYLLAPQVVRALYSDSFSATERVLRWQLLGDIFKVPAWALSFVLVARGQARRYFLVELFWSLCYYGLVRLLLARWGLEATGLAFVLAYVLQLALLWALLRQSIGFRWDRATARTFWLLCGGGALLLLAEALVSWALPIQAIMSVALTLMLLGRLKAAAGVESWRAILGWIKKPSAQ